MAKDERARVNLFLAVLGILCFAVAAIGLFMDRNEGLSGGFLIGGIFLCVASVMAPRMEGEQQVGLTGAKFTLNKLPPAIEAAEKELATKQLPEIEDIL